MFWPIPPLQYFHWRTLSAETWLDLLFHLHLSVHSCRSRQSTGSLPRQPLLVCQQGCHATQSTCVPPCHLMTRTLEVGAEGSRHPWDWNVHTQSSLLCRLCMPIMRSICRTHHNHFSNRTWKQNVHKVFMLSVFEPIGLLNNKKRKRGRHRHTCQYSTGWKMCWKSPN